MELGLPQGTGVLYLDFIPTGSVLQGTFQDIETAVNSGALVVLRARHTGGPQTGMMFLYQLGSFKPGTEATFVAAYAISGSGANHRSIIINANNEVTSIPS